MAGRGRFYCAMPVMQANQGHLVQTHFSVSHVSLLCPRYTTSMLILFTGIEYKLAGGGF